jgi:lysine/ornithine N-monooxygenase
MMDLNEGLQKAEMTDFLSGLAGQVSGMIGGVQSAAEIVEDIINEAAEGLDNNLSAKTSAS